jgi:hypothetical protein
MIADALMANGLDQPIEQHRGIAVANSGAHAVTGQVANDMIDQAMVAGDTADPRDEPGRMFKSG